MAGDRYSLSGTPPTSLRRLPRWRSLTRQSWPEEFANARVMGGARAAAVIEAAFRIGRDLSGVQAALSATSVIGNALSTRRLTFACTVQRDGMLCLANVGARYFVGGLSTVSEFGISVWIQP